MNYGVHVQLNRSHLITGKIPTSRQPDQLVLFVFHFFSADKFLILISFPFLIFGKNLGAGVQRDAPCIPHHKLLPGHFNYDDRPDLLYHFLGQHVACKSTNKHNSLNENAKQSSQPSNLYISNAKIITRPLYISKTIIQNG